MGSEQSKVTRMVALVERMDHAMTRVMEKVEHMSKAMDSLDIRADAVDQLISSRITEVNKLAERIESAVRPVERKTENRTLRVLCTNGEFVDWSHELCVCFPNSFFTKAFQWNRTDTIEAMHDSITVLNVREYLIARKWGTPKLVGDLADVLEAYNVSDKIQVVHSRPIVEGSEYEVCQTRINDDEFRDTIVLDGNYCRYWKNTVSYDERVSEVRDRQRRLMYRTKDTDNKEYPCYVIKFVGEGLAQVHFMGWSDKFNEVVNVANLKPFSL